jgi:hypothetical protein
MSEMVARQVSSLVKSHLPFMQPLFVTNVLFLVIFEHLFMLSQCFTITSFLMPHMRRINIVENRQNFPTILFLEAMNDVDKFIKAKRRRSIVDREHKNAYQKVQIPLSERALWR